MIGSFPLKGQLGLLGERKFSYDVRVNRALIHTTTSSCTLIELLPTRLWHTENHRCPSEEGKMLVDILGMKPTAEQPATVTSTLISSPHKEVEKRLLEVSYINHLAS